jgi:sugar phosphate isomerase/epimerase
VIDTLKLVTDGHLAEDTVYVGLPLLPGDGAVDWAEVMRLIDRYREHGEPIPWRAIRLGGAA